eukprot:GHVP01033066.1.p1 GENE.GHVP01033066.1~~GHVP01033066.1.p1  ORF type:complete len:1149 (+),score=190.92 GHVP01033066.1:56-3502(+)
MKAFFVAALLEALWIVGTLSVLAESQIPQFSYEEVARKEHVSKYYRSPFLISAPKPEIHHYHHHHVYHHYLTKEDQTAFAAERCEAISTEINDHSIKNELASRVQTLTTFSSSQTASIPSWYQNYDSSSNTPINPPVITPTSTDKSTVKVSGSIKDCTLENSLLAYPSGGGKAIFLNSECVPVDLRIRLQEFLKLYCEAAEETSIEFKIVALGSCLKDTLIDDFNAISKCEEHRNSLDKDSLEFQALGDRCFELDQLATFDAENDIPSGWSLFPKGLKDDILFCSPKQIGFKPTEYSLNKPTINKNYPKSLPNPKKFVIPVSNGKEFAFRFNHPNPETFSNRIYNEQLTNQVENFAIEVVSGVGLLEFFPVRSLNMMELKISQRPEQVPKNIYFVDAMDSEKTIIKWMKQRVYSFCNMMREKTGIFRTEAPSKLGVPLFIFRDKAELRLLLNSIMLPSPLYAKTPTPQLDLLFVSTIAKNLRGVPFSCVIQGSNNAAIVTPSRGQSIEALEAAFSSEFVDYSKVQFSVFEPIQGPLPLAHGLHDLPTSTAMLLIVPEYLLSELKSDRGLAWLKFPGELAQENLNSPLNGMFIDLSPHLEDNRFPLDLGDKRSLKIPYLEFFVGVFVIFGMVTSAKIFYEVVVFSTCKLRIYYKRALGIPVPAEAVTLQKESTQKTVNENEKSVPEQPSEPTNSNRAKEQKVPNDNVLKLPRPRTQSDVSKSIDNGKLKRQFDEQTLKVLGFGSYGVVFRIQNSVEPQKPMYAIKVLTLRITPKGFAQPEHSAEVDAYTSITSKHVVRYFTWWFEELSHLPDFVRKQLDVHRPNIKKTNPSILEEASSLGINDKIFRHYGGSDVEFAYTSSSAARMPQSQSEVQTFEPTSDESHKEPLNKKPLKKNISVDSIVESDPVYLLIQMEYLPGDTLRNWLTQNTRVCTNFKEVLELKDRPFPEKGHVCKEKALYGVELFYFYQLVTGLRDIHEAKYVHRDLKPENIYVSYDKWTLKIGDFGLATKIIESTQDGRGRNSAMPNGCNGADVGEKTSMAGTRPYNAPEAFASFKSDIFSTALILIELLSPKFKTDMERITIFDDFKKNLEVPSWIKEIDPLYKLLLKMGQKEPDKRPTANEVLKELSDWQIWDRFFEGHLCVCAEK